MNWGTIPTCIRIAGFERVFALFPPSAEGAHTQRGGTLSGGEQQMLAIGRAPSPADAHGPRSGGPLIARQIFDAIRTLNRQDGLTALISNRNSRTVASSWPTA